MSELQCNGCIQCCQWGKENTLRPVLTIKEAKKYKSQMVGGVPRLKATVLGECVYLEYNGCTIHDDAPEACRKFDCRALYQQIMKDTGTLMIKVLLQGALRSDNDKR